MEDSFGRRLAFVYDISGNSIVVQLFAGGFATAWTRYGQHRSKQRSNPSFCSIAPMFGSHGSRSDPAPNAGGPLAGTRGASAKHVGARSAL
ncbi:MAG: hypothetical protein IIB25_13185 [Chloroflexi bacterium]|nr:hypothetical protein [Chloroflexota bacterium]